MVTLLIFGRMNGFSIVFSRKVFTNKGQNVITKVSDMINLATNLWDEALIDQAFWKIDAYPIKYIPLPQHDMTDFVAWHLMKNGIFSVRSAYHAEWEMQYGRKLLPLNIN
jgi:hypothetical protein